MMWITRECHDKALATKADNQRMREIKRVADVKRTLEADPSLTLTQVGMVLGLSNGAIVSALRRQEDKTFMEFKRSVVGVTL